MDEDAVPSIILPAHAEVQISYEDGEARITVRDANGDPLEISAVELGTIITIAIMTIGANIIMEE